MSKIPRNIGAKELIRLLKNYGYHEVRQKGSHIRLESVDKKKIHKITIPEHNPIKIGTLNNILDSVAVYLGMTKSELVQKLF
ncbi:MAG TPA: hypothetical protein DHW82_11630 [Spirochaetia bacterium]|nr:MAG: hypothetical protein A2Y41_09580 [Spirochaetes bacterium GWB1_36_13]HCL57642.1 hypothetical protein [Spirochaetia bacterium]